MKYEPQQALLVAEPPKGDKWVHELKLDGYRIGVVVSGKSVRLFTRRGTDYTTEYPELVRDAKQLEAKSATLDGELVVLDERGVSSFQALQQRGTSRSQLAYFAFDLISLNGKSLTGETLEERKGKLRALVGKGVGIIRYNEHFDTDGAEVFRQACALGAEGIISKRRDGPYRSGSRHPDWQKIKCIKRQELVVGGFTDPSGSRVGVGSILVGYYEGDELRFAGKVGTGPGWNAEFGRELRRKLEAIETTTCPYIPRPKGWLGKNAHWVKPRLVAEVEFTEWTGDGSVRHPSLQGFRRDKKPTEVVREEPVAVGSGVGGRTLAKRIVGAGRADAGDKAAQHRARLAYPRARLTNGDLVSLYADIMKWALPHVIDRPLTLVRRRMPITRDDALRSQCAFLHHTAKDQAALPRDIPRLGIREQKKLGEYLYVDSPDALLALVDHDIVEWHVWNARVKDVEQPDRVVFDLDPGSGVEWADVVSAARSLRKVLRSVSLESWVKTTGGKGLHVVVPFKPRHSWDAAFEFSRQVAEAMAADAPQKFTTAFAKSARHGRVLIDYKRNYRTSIAVAGFSLRARPDAALSVPVRWEELGRIRPDQFTAKNIRERLGRLKADPWEDYWNAKQQLGARVVA